MVQSKDVEGTGRYDLFQDTLSAFAWKDWENTWKTWWSVSWPVICTRHKHHEDVGKLKFSSTFTVYGGHQPHILPGPKGTDWCGCHEEKFSSPPRTESLFITYLAHSIVTVASGVFLLLFHFSIIDLHTYDSACHLLPCCHLARLVCPPWRWRLDLPSNHQLTFQWTTHYIPEDSTLHNHCCENLAVTDIFKFVCILQGRGHAVV